MQDAGTPVVVTNPGAVYGPHDPHMGESATLVRRMLRGGQRLVVRGGFALVDVRDVATAHARLFTAGRGPRRYLLGGHWISHAGLYRVLAEVVGHRLPRIRIPMAAAVVGGRLADAAQRRGIDPGLSSASVWSVANHPRVDDRETRRDLGIDWRPVDDTMRDTVAWLHEQGQVSRRQAGLAAGAGWSVADTSQPEPA